MAKSFGSAAILALNLFASLTFLQPVFAEENEDALKEDADLPDMEFLIYLGGWEINDQQAEEPLYWYDMDTTDIHNDKNTTETEAANRHEAN